MSNEKKVWVRGIRSGKKESYFIALGFPHIDYKRQFILEHKRHNTQVLDSDVIFTTEEEAELKKLSDLNSKALKGERSYQGIQTMPDKLWTSDIKTPTEDEHTFNITGSALILSEACGDIVQQFNLGKTRLAKVQIYNMRTLEADDERFFYFLDISEWRNYLLPEESGKSAHSSGYAKHGYDRYTYRSYNGSLVLSKDAEQCDLDIWHDPMLMDSVFISDRLYKALEQAGMTESWFLHPCEQA